jgi:predicted signal transduction protein with EAL and GGDEF domain
MEVVIEGVETELQQRQLCALGATLFQGYLYGKPMALAEIDQWFLSSAFAAAPSEVPAEHTDTDTGAAQPSSARR